MLHRILKTRWPPHIRYTLCIEKLYIGLAMINGTPLLANWYHTTPLILAHRGDSVNAPENTLAAFRLAQAIGADGIELDTSLSADGVPMVIHNLTLDATTDGHGRVADQPVRALKQLDVGSHFDSSFKGESIPTLAEVFETIGSQLIVNVELKSYSARPNGLEAATLAVIKPHNAARRVLISSFNPFALRRMFRLAPDLPIGLLYFPRSYALMRLLTVGLPIQALHPAQAGVTARFIRSAHRRRFRVNSWTVDHPVRATYLRDFGVDALITNDPTAIMEAMGRFKAIRARSA